MKDTLQCLEEIMCQYQDTSNIILFGHGVGGLLAGLIAAQIPEIVKGLVLHGPIFKVLLADTLNSTFLILLLQTITGQSITM